jgi:RNA polymerase sigma-70 factor (ECF subfamily)
MTSAGFHNVWLPLQGQFYRIAFYILENEADAKDAVQDLYLKLWKLRDSLDLVRNPSAYGALMLKNLCIDRIRRKQPYGLLEETMADDPPPDKALEERERLQAVNNAIESLPSGQQKLIKMRVLDGLSYKEISKQTGLGQLNIRVQVSQARKKLKDYEKGH